MSRLIDELDHALVVKDWIPMSPRRYQSPVRAQSVRAKDEVESQRLLW